MSNSQGGSPATVNTVNQQHIAEYHSELLAMHGHDMHSFHADWHAQNPDPRRPSRPTRAWGADIPFGSNFLQMHHEMVNAEDGEPKRFMEHSSIVSWYKSKTYSLPALWDPLQPIPDDMGFDPQPPTITLQDGQPFSLQRKTDNPRFMLPGHFSTQGVSDTEPGEPITGARKLADFINVNQLGCCIVFPHNSWHNAIGGAMLLTYTAIDDPVFYLGVHMHIDLVYMEFQNVTAGRAPADIPEIRPNPEFSPEQIRELDDAARIGEMLRRRSQLRMKQV